MAFDPIMKTITAAGRTLIEQANQTAMRGTGLGIDADIDPFLTAANTAAALTVLGFSAFVQTTIDDADAAAFKATIGALGLMTHVAKTNADTPYTVPGANYFVECDTSGGVLSVVFPALAGLNVGDKIAVGLRTAGNTLTVDGNASETINGATTDTMSIAGQIRIYEVNGAKNDWIIT